MRIKALLYVVVATLGLVLHAGPAASAVPAASAGTADQIVAPARPAAWFSDRPAAWFSEPCEPDLWPAPPCPGQDCPEPKGGWLA
jgi:hypothetical protein